MASSSFLLGLVLLGRGVSRGIFLSLAALRLCLRFGLRSCLHLRCGGAPGSLHTLSQQPQQAANQNTSSADSAPDFTRSSIAMASIPLIKKKNDKLTMCGKQMRSLQPLCFVKVFEQLLELPWPERTRNASDKASVAFSNPLTTPCRYVPSIFSSSSTNFSLQAFTSFRSLSVTHGVDQMARVARHA